MGRLETFAAQVHDGLQQADFQTRREIIRSLVKRVEVDQQHIRVVFRVSPTSVLPSTDNTPNNWQDSGRRVHARALHRHDWAVLRHEPITEGKQLRVDGTKLTPLSRDLAGIVDMAQTRGQACLMHIETTTNWVHHLHRGVLLHQVDPSGGQTTGLRLQVGYSHA